MSRRCNHILLHAAVASVACLTQTIVAKGGEPASRSAGAPFASEYELLRKLPPSLIGLVTKTGVPDAQGLVKSGKWYEAGQQRSGCWMVIGAVIAGDEKRADDAWRSIDATFAHQVADGGFLSVRKPGDQHEPTLPERVETAFFFLQELGHAILVVQASPMAAHFQDPIVALEPKIRRACAFIQKGYNGIILKAGHTANRMLIAAKAFGLCGLILKDESLMATSRKLVQVALARRDADGVFIEKGGRDSSYNAVSILMGQVLAIHLPYPELDAALVRAVAWQRTRIRPTGEVEVAGNTRTGLGQEVTMGIPKGVNYREVALAFSYFGMMHNDTEALALAEKVYNWSNRPKP